MLNANVTKLKILCISSFINNESHKTYNYMRTQWSPWNWPEFSMAHNIDLSGLVLNIHGFSLMELCVLLDSKMIYRVGHMFIG